MVCRLARTHRPRQALASSAPEKAGPLRLSCRIHAERLLQQAHLVFGAAINEDLLIAAIRQRASNPATRSDFADRRHRELGPAASADAIEAAEKEIGCRFHQFYGRLFKEVGNGGFGPGDGLIGLPGGSLDVQQRSVIKLRQGLFSDREKL